MLKILNIKPSLLSVFLSELRDISVQQDRMRFRNNIIRIGEIMAYEISKELTWIQDEIETPLSKMKSFKLEKQPVLATVLRAGLPFHQGFLNFFDHADNAFISAYRKHKQNSPEFEIIVEYLASPSIKKRTLILVDPMLATGQSMHLTYLALLEKGIPEEVHLASVIASPEGISYVEKHMPDAHLWVAAVDDSLNQNQYIVPGLGDAGDLAFGIKE